MIYLGHGQIYASGRTIYLFYGKIYLPGGKQNDKSQFNFK